MHDQARHSVTESICRPALQQGLSQAVSPKGSKEGLESQGVRKEGTACPHSSSLLTASEEGLAHPLTEAGRHIPRQKKSPPGASGPVSRHPCRPRAATLPRAGPFPQRALPLSGAPRPGSPGGAGPRPAGGSSGARTNCRQVPRNGPNGRRGGAGRRASASARPGAHRLPPGTPRRLRGRPSVLVAGRRGVGLAGQGAGPCAEAALGTGGCPASRGCLQGALEPPSPCPAPSPPNGAA